MYNFEYYDIIRIEYSKWPISPFIVTLRHYFQKKRLTREQKQFEAPAPAVSIRCILKLPVPPDHSLDVDHRTSSAHLLISLMTQPGASGNDLCIW